MIAIRGVGTVITDDESDAQGIVQRYPVGQTVTVYYDPVIFGTEHLSC